ncbi:membrane associated rhomboid family serine protease [Paraburkholderia sp. Clong3]|uniref:hypothetical protein n=1 Tax=unclassified Paraburkholderia TaxID=2615204 RepID=UPI003D207214
MSDEIVSGIIGGLFGPLIGKFLGKFRLWKVFVVSIILLYGAAFVLGLVVVGFKTTIARFGQLFLPLPMLIFLSLSACATFVAFLGRDAIRKAGEDKS